MHLFVEFSIKKMDMEGSTPEPYKITIKITVATYLVSIQLVNNAVTYRSTDDL